MEGHICGSHRVVHELFLLFLSMLPPLLLFLFWKMNQAYDQDALHLFLLYPYSNQVLGVLDCFRRDQKGAGNINVNLSKLLTDS